MSAKLATALLAAMVIAPWQASAAMHWIPAPAKPGLGMHDRSAAKAFVLIDGLNAETVMVDPGLEQKALPVEQGRVVLSPTGMDNYHALVASRSSEQLHETAVRYVYMHGKPSGESPASLMHALKGELEIEPAPYAREHWHYQAAGRADFLIRFKGLPLPNAQVELMTSNGSTQRLIADRTGQVSVLLPDDFITTRSGRGGNPPAELLLSASHHDNGMLYRSTLSADYHVDPSHWQSLPLALLTMAGGMGLGGLMSWRMRRNKEQ